VERGRFGKSDSKSADLAGVHLAGERRRHIDVPQYGLRFRVEHLSGFGEV
jgi:hypothetical protein